MREVAAYLLDHGGWARVPTTVLVRARHPAFCYNQCVCAAAVRNACAGDALAVSILACLPKMACLSA